MSITYSTDRIKLQIRTNAREASRLHARIHATFGARDRSCMHWNEWLRACREFHDRYDGLAFPGGYSDAFERIHSGDPDAIEAAICFLEIRPYFFRSGYMFKDLLRKVRHAQLSSSQAARFQSIQAAVTAWKAKKAAALRKTAP